MARTTLFMRFLKYNLYCFLFLFIIIFFIKDGRLPVYDDQHNIVMSNFSKEELIRFIQNNYTFLRNYSLLFLFAGIIFIGSLAYFFLFEY